MVERKFYVSWVLVGPRGPRLMMIDAPYLKDRSQKDEHDKKNKEIHVDRRQIGRVL